MCDVGFVFAFGGDTLGSLLVASHESPGVHNLVRDGTIRAVVRFELFFQELWHGSWSLKVHRRDPCEPTELAPEDGPIHTGSTGSPGHATVEPRGVELENIGYASANADGVDELGRRGDVGDREREGSARAIGYFEFDEIGRGRGQRGRRRGNGLLLYTDFFW